MVLGGTIASLGRTAIGLRQARRAPQGGEPDCTATTMHGESLNHTAGMAAARAKRNAKAGESPVTGEGRGDSCGPDSVAAGGNPPVDLGRDTGNQPAPSPL